MKKIFALFTLEITSGDSPIEASFLADISATNATDYGELDEWQTAHDMDVGEFQLNLECEYGVHDFCGYCEFNDDEKAIIHLGFDSYEVKEERLDELMGKWTEAFARQLGADKVSNVHKGPGENLDSSLKAMYDRLAPFLALPS